MVTTIVCDTYIVTTMVTTSL